MTARISPPLQRLAALSILMLLAGAVVTGIVEPLVSAYLDAQRTVARQQAAISHTRLVGADAETLRAELARLRSQPQAIPGMLRSTNDSLAAAELQNRLKAAIDAAHGELRSVQPLPSRVEGVLRRVAVRGQARLRIAGLRHALYDLESSSPMLFLDNVEIEARPDKSGRPGAAEDPNLDLRFDLYGYIRASP